MIDKKELVNYLMNWRASLGKTFQDDVINIVLDIILKKVESFDCNEKLKELEDLEEQGLLLRLPCVAGQKVYIIATCKDFANFDDYNIYGDEDYFYCPYEIGEKCPFDECFDECIGGCENFKDTSTIFEDYVESIMCYENENVVFFGNYGSAGFHYFGKTVFLNKAEAEKALAEMKGE